MDAAQNRSTIWVTGPAGAGKTSLVASYVAQAARECLWLTVDADDKDPATFFFYLLEAVRVVRPKAILPAFSPDFEEGLDSFARQYARKLLPLLTPTSVLVIDNLEVVGANSPVHEVLSILARELHAGQQLFITSREAPSPAFSPLVMASSLLELSNDELRFTAEEATQLRDLRGEAGSPPAEELMRWAQGWVAAMVLALEHPDKMDTQLPEGAAPQVLFDYFAVEVLASLSEQEEDFLLRTSFLPEFSIALAQRVTQHSSPKKILDRLQSKNFFVVKLKGAKGSQYRYHPLFRAFLQKRVSETLEEDERKALSLEAARELIEEGDVEKAVELLKNGEDWVALDALICEHAPRWLELGWHKRVYEWTELPPHVEKSPWLRYWRGMSLLPYDATGARPDLINAHRSFVAQGSVDAIFLSISSVMESIIYSWRGFSDLDPWIEKVDTFLQQYGKPTFRVMARLSGVTFTARNARRFGAPSSKPWDVRARRLLMLARLFAPSDYILLASTTIIHDLYLGRVERARTLAEIVTSLQGTSRVNPVSEVTSFGMRAAYAWLSGRWDDCMSVSLEGLRVGQDLGVHFWDPILCAYGGTAALHLGKPEVARELAETLAKVTSPGAEMHQLLLDDLHTALALHEGDVEKAVAYAQHCVDLSIPFGEMFNLATMRLALSQTLSIAGRVEQAASELAPALEEATAAGMLPLVARCQLLRAELALARGNDDEAHEALSIGFGLAAQHAWRALPWWRANEFSRLAGEALLRGIEPVHVRKMIQAHQLQAPKGYERIWPGTIEVTTLGGFQVRVEGNELKASTRSKRPLDLLIALICLGGQDVTDAALGEALWPDAEGDAVTQSIKTTTHRLRKLLGPNVVIRTRGRLSLSPSCWVDAHRCAEFLSAPQLRQLSTKEALERVRAYTGELLPGGEAPHVLAYRRELQDKYCHAVLNLSDRLHDEGDRAMAIELLREAVRHAPEAESLHERLVHLLKEDGRAAEADDAQRARSTTPAFIH